MADDILEHYIQQHIQAANDASIFFSWHGGEPTLAGLDFYKKAVAIQKQNQPPDTIILNGLQTNGTRLDDEWGRFLAEEQFAVGLSLDGPEKMHDRYRYDKRRQPSFKKSIRGLQVLRKHQVQTELLCVVNDYNVQFPLEVYRFFKELGISYLTFLPLVKQVEGNLQAVTPASVPSGAFGHFLCTIFDEWVAQDIGTVQIQIFEEATRMAFNQDHTLCIFKKTCGGVPVVEHNGDFYSCDHFVNPDHHIGNIYHTSLKQLLEDPRQKAFGQAKWDTLPAYCMDCEVLAMCHGECPKNRFIRTPEGESGLNYLCAGYRLFFNHIQTFVEEVARVWRHQNEI